MTQWLLLSRPWVRSPPTGWRCIGCAAHPSPPCRRFLSALLLAVATRRFITAIAATVAPQLTSRPVAQQRRRWLHVPIFGALAVHALQLQPAAHHPFPRRHRPPQASRPPFPCCSRPATAHQSAPQALLGCSTYSAISLRLVLLLHLTQTSPVGSLPLLAEASCCRTRAVCRRPRPKQQTTTAPRQQKAEAWQLREKVIQFF